MSDSNVINELVSELVKAVSDLSSKNDFTTKKRNENDVDNKIIDGNLILEWFEKTVDAVEKGQSLSSIYGKNEEEKDLLTNKIETERHALLYVESGPTSFQESLVEINNEKISIISSNDAMQHENIELLEQSANEIVKSSTATWDTTFVPTMIGAVVSTQLSKKLQENKSSDETSSVDDSSSDSDITSESSENSMILSSKSVIDNKEQDDCSTMTKHKISRVMSAKNILLESKPMVNEILPVLPDNAELEHIGNISSLIENSVVVIKALPYKVALNLDSILFLEDKSVLGEIYETFGPVNSPYYVICFKDGKTPENLAVNQRVYFAPQVESLTKYVFATELQKIKGSDASWKNDDEPPENMLDYSDDEQERLAKKKRSRKRPDPCGKKSDDEDSTDNSADRHQQTHQSGRWRGRGRGAWTNCSVRYANPEPNNMQSGWVNAFENLPSRRGNSNFAMARYQQPVVMAPHVSPLRNFSPFQNQYPVGCPRAIPPFIPCPRSWNRPQIPPFTAQTPTQNEQNLPDMSTLFNKPPSL